MRLLIFISIILFPFFGFSQSQVVVNNNACINIMNRANFILKNGGAIILSSAETGGIIISEEENNLIRCKNIGNLQNKFNFLMKRVEALDDK